MTSLGAGGGAALRLSPGSSGIAPLVGLLLLKGSRLCVCGAGLQSRRKQQRSWTKSASHPLLGNEGSPSPELLMMLVMSKEATSAASSRCSFRARHFSKEGLPGAEAAHDPPSLAAKTLSLQPPRYSQPHPSCPGLPALPGEHSGVPCVSGRNPAASCSFDGHHRPGCSA